MELLVPNGTLRCEIHIGEHGQTAESNPGHGEQGVSTAAKVVDRDTTRTRLLPPEAFSNARPEPKEGTDPEHHPIIVMAFASGCSGMSRVPTIEEFNAAVGGGTISRNERQAVRLVLNGVDTLGLVQAYREGAYSMRGLVRAMHAVFGETGHDRERIKSINYWREGKWTGDIHEYDPCPDSFQEPRRKRKR